MCIKMEAKEKQEKERERKEKEEQEGAREAALALEKSKTTEEKMKKASHWFGVKVRARKALTASLAAKAAEKKDPPENQNAKWWGDPVPISENELMIKGIKGWSMQSIKALVVEAIGTKVKPNIKKVSGGYLACVQFRNKEESEAALPKMRYLRNPIPGAMPEWLSCIRAKAKRSCYTVEHEKEVADAEEEWNTQRKKGEERTKDKEKSEEGCGANQKDGPGSPSSHQEEETIAPAGPTPRAEEEPETSAFWTNDQADTAVSDETYERIEILRSQFPEYWKKLMEIETPFLSNEEALAEVRSLEKRC
jgi:hypothetical protein